MSCVGCKFNQTTRTQGFLTDLCASFAGNTKDLNRGGGDIKEKMLQLEARGEKHRAPRCSEDRTMMGTRRNV